jgi:hypothetical protein
MIIKYSQTELLIFIAQRLIKKIKINLENFALKIRLMFAFKKQNGEKRKYF